MEFIDRLYVSDSLKGKENRIKRMILKQKNLPYAYVVTAAANASNLMDVIAVKEINRRSYPTRGMIILGIAGNQGEAMKLVEQILQDTYRELHSVDIWTFFHLERRNRL